MEKVSEILFLIACYGLVSTSQCASHSGTGNTILGNERGSRPINGKEEILYKRAILKCYKTGGSRIVKIQGKLRCY